MKKTIKKKKTTRKATKDYTDIWIHIAVLRGEINKKLNAILDAVKQNEERLGQQQAFLNHTLDIQTIAIQKMQLWLEGRLTSSQHVEQNLKKRFKHAKKSRS